MRFSTLLIALQINQNEDVYFFFVFSKKTTQSSCHCLHQVQILYNLWKRKRWVILFRQFIKDLTTIFWTITLSLTQPSFCKKIALPVRVLSGVEITMCANYYTPKQSSNNKINRRPVDWYSRNTSFEQKAIAPDCVNVFPKSFIWCLYFSFG